MEQIKSSIRYDLDIAASFVTTKKASGYGAFSEVLGGRPPCFSRLISGGNRSPRLVGGMRSPASKKRDANKS